MRKSLLSIALSSLFVVSSFGAQYEDLAEYEKDFLRRLELISEEGLCISDECLRNAFDRFKTKEDLAEFLYILCEKDLESAKVEDDRETMTLVFSVTYPLENKIVRLSLLFDYGEDDSILDVSYATLFIL